MKKKWSYLSNRKKNPRFFDYNNLDVSKIVFPENIITSGCAVVNKPKNSKPEK